MRKVLFAGILLAACPLAAQAQAENYKIDPIHSFPHFGIDHFGASAPFADIYKGLGLTVDKLVEAARGLVAR